MTAKTKQQNKKISKLRFSEFGGGWEKKRLGEVGEPYNGLSGKTKDDFGNGSKFITYKQIFDNTKIDVSKCSFVKISKNERQNKVQYGDIFFTTSSETPLEVGFSSVLLDKVSDVYLNSFCFGFRPKSFNILDPNFARFFFRSPEIRKKIVRLAQGSTRYNISKIEFLKIKINFPSLPEQQKIAGFLSAVDERIKILRDKREALAKYKKGIMQKIFSQEIRFKDDNGKDFPDWEEKRLGEVLDYEQPTKYIIKNTEYSNNYKIPVLTAGKTFILGYTNEEVGIYKNVPVIIFDDFTTANKYIDFPFKVKSSAMKILKTKNNSYNLRFIFEAMQLIRFELGDEHKRFWISEYSKIKIKIPSLLEQQKIANFLSVIDKKIELVDVQIQKMQEWKRELMQGLFV